MANEYTGLDRAKKALELLLEKEWLLRGNAPSEHLEYMQQKYPTTDWTNYLEGCCFLRQNMPEIIPGGTNQVVFQLEGGYIGKTKTKKRGQMTSGHYVIGNVYASKSEATVRALEDLGFDVPEHHYVKVERQGEIFVVRDHGLMFAIAEDLAQEGRYVVDDVTKELLRSINNGAEIKAEFKKCFEVLKNIYKLKNLPYSLSASGHGTITDSDEAIRRTFLLQIDTQTNIGRLVAGDLDNIIMIGPRDSS